jgi:hypothetical protein
MRMTTTIDRLESLFNAIQRVREKRIARRLTDATFVHRHFPYHETVARRETLWLSALQANLMATLDEVLV